jgi:hypothetical protein
MQQPPTHDYSIVQFVKAMSILGSIHGYNLGQLSFLFMLKEEARCLKEGKEYYQKFLAKDNLPQVYIPTNEIGRIIGLKCQVAKCGERHCILQFGPKDKILGP